MIKLPDYMTGHLSGVQMWHTPDAQKHACALLTALFTSRFEDGMMNSSDVSDLQESHFALSRAQFLGITYGRRRLHLDMHAGFKQEIPTDEALAFVEVAMEYLGIPRKTSYPAGSVEALKSMALMDLTETIESLEVLAQPVTPARERWLKISGKTLD